MPEKRISQAENDFPFDRMKASFHIFHLPAGASGLPAHLKGTPREVTSRPGENETQGLASGVSS
jgi:hypothetical protein